MKRAKTIVLLLMGLFITIGARYGLAETQAGAKTKSEIHDRKDFDAYLAKFNSRDYQGFLDYFADKFEMIHVGGNLKSREEVMKFYRFLHSYIKESVIVDRLVMDRDTIAMEARVRIEGIKELTPEAVAASDYPRLKPLKVGETAIIPQFIHYHISNGKFTKVECKE
jgi:predicted signal transduction protein with EAL and GGDEF domain